MLGADGELDVFKIKHDPRDRKDAFVHGLLDAKDPAGKDGVVFVDGGGPLRRGDDRGDDLSWQPLDGLEIDADAGIDVVISDGGDGPGPRVADAADDAGWPAGHEVVVGKQRIGARPAEGLKRCPSGPSSRRKLATAHGHCIGNDHRLDGMDRVVIGHGHRGRRRRWWQQAVQQREERLGQGVRAPVVSS